MYFPYLVPVLFYDIISDTYVFIPSLINFDREVYINIYISPIKNLNFNSTTRTVTIFNRSGYINVFNSPIKTIVFVAATRNLATFNRSEYINNYTPSIKNLNFNVQVRDGDPV